MNEDEIQLVARIRPDAAPYDPEAKAAARRGLAAASAARTPVRSLWRRPWVALPAGALAVAVGIAATVLAGRTGPERGPVQEVVVALPRLAPMSASEVLGRAARAAARTDLEPRDDQFVKVESETMYGAFSEDSRYLYRTKRVIWQSTDGTREGSLRIEHLEPRAYPGWPIPESAYDEVGTVDLHRLPVCDPVPDHLRTDHAAVKRLPADAEGMRAHLYTGDRGGNSRDEAAWTRVGDLLRENYVPAAQRAALFEAAATIPGVDAVGDAEDAAGRKGIAVGRVGPDGVREDLIFHPETYELLGERGIVVDEKLAESPAGSLVASTAELSVSVTDEAPEIDDERAGCM
ncbi:CU044_5270 family protein [Planomonospora algeriensis]